MARVGILGSAVAVALVVVLATPALAALDQTLLASRASGLAGAPGDDRSTAPSVSPDGRYVAFQSAAENLVPGQSQQIDNDNVGVFLRDLQTGTTTLISRANSGVKVTDDSVNPVFSGNGRYVVFASEAKLSENTPAGATDWKYYVRDLGANPPTNSFVDSAGEAPVTQYAADNFKAEISADGRYVAFVALDSGINPGDDTADADIFLRDRSNDSLRLISRADGVPGNAGVAANADSTNPSISDDGTRVAYLSFATNLSNADAPQAQDVFLRDVPTLQTSLVSASPTAGAGNGNSFDPDIAGNGHYVAFSSQSSNLVGGVSGNPDIFRRDVRTESGGVEHVSRTGPNGPGGFPADSRSDNPDVSADGRYVVFSSIANNLSSEDRDSNVEDVFLRDVQGGQTVLVSRPEGFAASADALSKTPSISGNGQWVAFQSDASNLVPGDTNGKTDVFRRDAFGPPPVNTAPPAISGTPGVGFTLSCNPGTWTPPSGLSLTGGWDRNGVAIPDAINPSYTVRKEDAGQSLTCRVTGRTLAGEAVAVSDPVAVPAPITPSFPDPAPFVPQQVTPPPPPPPPPAPPAPPRRSSTGGSGTAGNPGPRALGLVASFSGKTLTVSFRLTRKASVRVLMRRQGLTARAPKRIVYTTVGATAAKTRVPGAYQVVLTLKKRPVPGAYQAQVVVNAAGVTTTAAKLLKVAAAG